MPRQFARRCPGPSPRPPRTGGSRSGSAGGPASLGSLAGAATLDAGALQQLAVLLLGHALATLLDDRTHCVPFIYRLGRWGDGCWPRVARLQILTRSVTITQLCSASHVPAALGARLHGREECGPDATLVQHPQRRGGGARWRGDLFAQLRGRPAVASMAAELTKVCVTRSTAWAWVSPFARQPDHRVGDVEEVRGLTDTDVSASIWPSITTDFLTGVHERGHLDQMLVGRVRAAHDASHAFADQRRGAGMTRTTAAPGDRSASSCLSGTPAAMETSPRCPALRGRRSPGARRRSGGGLTARTTTSDSAARRRVVASTPYFSRISSARACAGSTIVRSPADQPDANHPASSASPMAPAPISVSVIGPAVRRSARCSAPRPCAGCRC